MARGQKGGPGNIAGFIGQLIGEGESATSGLDRFREAGGRVRTQTWYRAWAETESVVTHRGDWASMDPGVRPRGDQISDWSAGRAGTYATQVQVLIRDADGFVSSRNFTHLDDRRHAPQEAIDDAVDTFDSATDEQGSGAGEHVIGAVVTGVFRMTGRQRT